MTPSPISFQTAKLSRGKHASPRDGTCVMELASMLAGEPFGDQPRCVCPVVGAVLRSYNDVCDDGRRQDLYRLAAAAVGTSGSVALAEARLRRCARVLAELPAPRRRPWRRWQRPPATPPAVTSVELERYGVRLARALHAAPEGHARAIALADELIAMREPSTAAPRRPVRAGREPAADPEPAAA
jgi:hypothetical protein